MLHTFWPCPGNHFHLLVGGDQCGPAFLSAIAEAEHYVVVELYLVESGNFASALIEALRDAADRGVAVFILLDGFGSSGLAAAERELLSHPRIRLVWYNPVELVKRLGNFQRDHRKLILVDQTVAFVGGFCVTDKFWAGPDPDRKQGKKIRPWLDVAVEIRGPVTAQWQDLFSQAWARVAEGPPALPKVPVQRAGTMIGRVAWASGHLHQGILREFLARARKARREIYVATPYFVPSWRIRRTLIRAAKRGIDVRLLLPGPRTDHPGVRFAAWRYYKKLLHHGVRIYEYQPSFIHAKMILVDDWVSIGSCNLDHWNQRWNLEANQEVSDIRFAAEVKGVFLDCFGESEEQGLGKWLRPIWRRRLLAYVWGRIDAWLMRL